MLTLLITLNKKTMAAGDMPELTARLINQGVEPLVVNSRMLLVPEGSPDYIKEMVVFIEGPPESINLKKFHVRAKAAEDGDFVRLLPGEYLFAIYPLEKYFSYKDAGSYLVFAEYYNERELVVDGIKSWKGRVRSNDEYFEITV